jgi:hypothetical protein
MIDENFKVYLIECNINPCLEVASPFMGRLVPNMIDNGLRFKINHSNNPYLGLQLILFFLHQLISQIQRGMLLIFYLKLKLN